MAAGWANLAGKCPSLDRLFSGSPGPGKDEQAKAGYKYDDHLVCDGFSSAKEHDLQEALLENLYQSFADVSTELFRSLRGVVDKILEIFF
jgi:hypothetical protein